MPKKKGYVTKYDGIYGVCTVAFDKSVFNKTKEGTFYGGIRVTEKVKNDLLKSELGDTLWVRKTLDHKYNILPKYPERGYDGQNSFNIRKNMNHLMKGFAQIFVQKNGEVNFREQRELLEEIQYDFVKSPEKVWNSQLQDHCRNIADYDSMSKRDKADFDKFINSPQTFSVVQKIIYDSIDFVSQLAGMCHAMEVDYLDKAHQDVIKDSMEDFENAVIMFQRAAEMDVDKEQQILNYTDCRGLAAICDGFGELAQNEKNRKEKRPAKKWEPGNIEISFAEKKRLDTHVIYGRTVKIGDKDVYVTLENTAAPAEKVIFQSNTRIGAVGVYDSKESCINHYREDNKIARPNINAAGEIRSYYGLIQKNDEFFHKPKVANSTVYLQYLMIKEGKGRNNSTLYKNVLRSLEEVRRKEDMMSEHPENKNNKEFMENMKAAYETLSEDAQKYMNERQGARSDMGKRRLDMMKTIIGHCDRKGTSLTNVIKDPNPKRIVLIHDEERRKDMEAIYAKEEENKLKQENSRNKKEEEVKGLEAIQEEEIELKA